MDFCKDLFLTFLYQYIAYKTRKTEYLALSGKQKGDFAVLKDAAKQEGFAYLLVKLCPDLFSQHHIAYSDDERWLG